MTDQIDSGLAGFGVVFMGLLEKTSEQGERSTHGTSDGVLLFPRVRVVMGTELP
jgi:hypothetical protein